jgi:REP element-mobilizing transposase RayT
MASPRLLIGRRSEPGHWYVITTVTRDRSPLFLQSDLANAVIDEIRSVPGESAETHAWVVMPDHLHWLMQLNAIAPLDRLVQRVKSRSAIAINRLRAATGPVWQPGYFDHRLRAEEDLQAQARYVVTNPLRREMVTGIEDYPHWWCRWIRTSADLAG